MGMMEGRDRISDLPDTLLTHILSFLPIEEAVHTCILAKRWMKVWASLPILIFLYDPADNLTTKEYRILETKFVRFLGGVISHREKITLDALKLTWLNTVSWGTLLPIFKFICCAVECRPRVLSIHFSQGDVKIVLPDSILSCMSVEEMSLSFENYEPLRDSHLKPRSINLPFLKKLELGYMHIIDDVMRMLISGCPILEVLVLVRCTLNGKMISSNVLKKLVLKDCYFGRMEISCPRVVSLNIETMLERGITLKNMSSLAMVDMLFKDSYGDTNDDLSLFTGFSNVTSLKLYTISSHIMGLLRADILTCPILKNLKSLELGALDFNNDWDLVACLLQHSSNLKDLMLHFYQGEISFQDEYLEAVKKIICPGKNVKLVEELVVDSLFALSLRLEEKVLEEAVVSGEMLEEEEAQKVLGEEGGEMLEEEEEAQKVLGEEGGDMLAEEEAQKVLGEEGCEMLAEEEAQKVLGEERGEMLAEEEAQKVLGEEGSEMLKEEAAQKVLGEEGGDGAVSSGGEGERRKSWLRIMLMGIFHFRFFGA